MAGSTSDPWRLSVAAHARGIVLRERGDVVGALRELRAALRLASRSGDLDREADVRATLGATLVIHGSTRAGLAQLGRAVTDVRSVDLKAKVLMRRGGVLAMVLGRHREALTDLEGALEGLRLAGQDVWEARTLNRLGLLYLATGDVDDAERCVVSARERFLRLDQRIEALLASHNLGVIAYAKGDLPTTLAIYDRLQADFDELGPHAVALAMDRLEALLAAGLGAEAAAVARDQLGREGLLSVQAAELELRLAMALLVVGDADGALGCARSALSSFRRQRRDWWSAHAELVVLRARAQSAPVDARLVSAAARVAATLEAERSEEAATAWLLAGSAATELGLAFGAVALGRAAEYRKHRSASVRARGWLAHGLECDEGADRRGVFLSCRRGLEALDMHRATLGSSELRASATVHGADLARLALRNAVTTPPRTFLWWSERWRVTSLAQPPVRPDEREDDELRARVAALRDNGRRLSVARSDGAETTRLEVERSQLEEEVRRRLHHARGSADGSRAVGLEIDSLASATDDAAFVELVEVGPELHAVVVRGGRFRKLHVGSVAEAHRAVDFAHFVLRQAARGRPAQLSAAGERLQRALIGPVAKAWGHGAVVVSPTGRLHAVPWGLLPALAGRPVTTVPSASMWLRARASQPDADSGTVLVVGPGLASGGAEVPVVAAAVPSAQTLRGPSATVDAALAALDGARLAHIAAHGHFRQDSPMFSSLTLADGPLFVHDLEGLTRAPHRVVLSACESGVMKPVGAGELLGLGAALLSMGTAGIVSSVAVVNDEATVEVMVALHRALRGGEGLGHALLAARQATAHDPTLAATAASFTALGV